MVGFRQGSSYPSAAACVLPAVTLPSLSAIPFLQSDDVRPTLPPLRASQPTSPVEPKPLHLAGNPPPLGHSFHSYQGFPSPARSPEYIAGPSTVTESSRGYGTDSSFMSNDCSLPYSRHDSAGSFEEMVDRTSRPTTIITRAGQRPKRRSTASPGPHRRSSAIAYSQSQKPSRRGSQANVEDDKASKSVKEQQSREDISTQILKIEGSHKLHGYVPAKRISTPNKEGTANRRGSGLDQTKVMVLSVENERQEHISNIMIQTFQDLSRSVGLEDLLRTGDAKAIETVIELLKTMLLRLQLPIHLSCASGQVIYCLPNEAMNMDAPRLVEEE